MRIDCPKCKNKLYSIHEAATHKPASGWGYCKNCDKMHKIKVIIEDKIKNKEKL